MAIQTLIEGRKPILQSDLNKMKQGEWFRLGDRGKLKEIHRVEGGWIYVFQLHNSSMTTEFISENQYAERG